jgi:hypothetical protein
MIAYPLCCRSGQGQQMQFDQLRRRKFIALMGSVGAALRDDQPSKVGKSLNRSDGIGREV